MMFHLALAGAPGAVGARAQLMDFFEAEHGRSLFDGVGFMVGWLDPGLISNVALS